MDLNKTLILFTDSFFFFQEKASILKESVKTSAANVSYTFPCRILLSDIFHDI